MATEKELKKHKDAFALYAKLEMEDCKDAFQQVADANKLSIKTIYNWSHLFSWSDRLEKMENAANEKALNKLSRQMTKQNIRFRENIIKNLRNVETNIVGSMDGQYSVKEMEIMAKLFLLINGEETERVGTNVRVELTEEEKGMIKDLGKNIDTMMNEAEVR